MAVLVESRIPEIVEEADVRARAAVHETCEEIADGARLNLIRHGSIDSGELFDSVHAEGDEEDYEGYVTAGEGLPDARAVYIELGTGVRGAAYQFPGKPEDVTYDMAWDRGIPKDLGNGFAYMIPALEIQREPFEERIGGIYG